MAVMVENKTMSWLFSVSTQNKIEIVTAFIGTYSFIYISDHESIRPNYYFVDCFAKLS